MSLEADARVQDDILEDEYGKLRDMIMEICPKKMVAETKDIEELVYAIEAKLKDQSNKLKRARAGLRSIILDLQYELTTWSGSNRRALLEGQISYLRRALRGVR